MNEQETQENTQTNPNPVLAKAIELADAGVTNALIIGMDDDELLILGSTLPSYEQMHSLINRAMFEITIQHHKYLLAVKEQKESKNEVSD